MEEFILDELLRRVEDLESVSLQWGYVDGSLSEDLVLSMATDTLSHFSTTIVADDLLERLIEQKLLFEVETQGGEPRIRSRFAEGVRLLKHLRQLMPQRPWRTAPELVSDYRVDVRPRLVPRREFPSAVLLDRMGLSPTSLKGRLTGALLRRKSKDLLLSRFQVEACVQVGLETGGNRGVVVSAGTGSGKTLAFYLPALTSIASEVRPDKAYVKALAIYPRKELLKDQFSSVFSLARQLDPLTQKELKATLRLGTYFGLTPSSCNVEAVRRVGWVARGSGPQETFICPFLRCPICDSDMHWSVSDIESGTERLKCVASRTCTFATKREMLALTRKGALDQPPDVVFTTGEMIHQRLSDTIYRKLLGVQDTPEFHPRFVLFDEIHTYEGSTGAQSALTFRRWRSAISGPITFVGLSATLQEAPRFFSELTGLPENRVHEVCPREEDLEQIGPSYQLILRGSPTSGAPLLSTSIQTAFLLARLLEPPHAPRTNGRIGRRLFAFTDDLDVANRFFDNLRSAEGYDIFGRPDPARFPLALLRASGHLDAAQRQTAGQTWPLCEFILWDLRERLRISRTTGQDQGVEGGSNIVIATSALEVGFDDPYVGAVLQHKSPQSLASFLQRKGRAGRANIMRPWMVTVLSDYGRDRTYYQSYEQLFQPLVPAQRLPIRNRYILRMQAAFAFIEWLANTAAASNQKAWWWRVLNGPADNNKDKGLQKWVLGVLGGLLKCEGDYERRLTSHLQKSLGLDIDEVVAVMWEAPRSLMLEVIPTLARRLLTSWTGPLSITDTKAPPGKVHPLPDFVPPNLFSDLNLPEVNIVVPPATVRHEERIESMPIVQAMRQLAPGRVTRRFAFERGQLNHWLPVPLDLGQHSLSVSTFAERFEYVANVPLALEGRVVDIPCFRPLQLRLQTISEMVVSPSTNATLQWCSLLVPSGEGLVYPTTGSGGWEAAVAQFEFLIHAFQSTISVSRYAAESLATLNRPRQPQFSVRTRFVDDGDNPAAIGFQQEVDGLSILVRLPPTEALANAAALSMHLPDWRPAFFRQLILSNPELNILANQFELEALCEIYLSTLIDLSCTRGISLKEANDLCRDADETSFESVLRTLGVDDADGDQAAQESSRVERLRGLLSSSSILEGLGGIAAVLWTEDTPGWAEWLRGQTYTTFGELLLQACLNLAPGHTSNDALLMDVGQQEKDGHSRRIWITESSPGGTGVVEFIARAFAGDQRSLSSAMRAATVPSDLELSSLNLDRFLHLTVNEPQISEAVALVRHALDHADRSTARCKLMNLLAAHGIGSHHAFSVALEHRLLRKGMTLEGDRILLQLLEYWKSEEKRLGVSINLRLFCHVAATDNFLGLNVLEWLTSISGGLLSQAEAVGVLAGILWPRPGEVRVKSLESYNPFRPRTYCDPAFLRELLDQEVVSEVDCSHPDAEKQIFDALAESGKVKIRALEATLLQQLLLTLLAKPVDVGFLHLFPVVEQAEREGDEVLVTLILPELAGL